VDLLKRAEDDFLSLQIRDDIQPSPLFINGKLSRRWILPMGRKWINPGRQL
jgi:hypothetical protein